MLSRNTLRVTRQQVPLRAWSWGYNNAGQLGTNSTTQRSSPVSVVGNLTSWTRVSAGLSSNSGITSDGQIYSWGAGGLGQLGNNAAANQSSPVSLVGGITSWQSVSVGLGHALAITSSGIAYAWGANSLNRAAGMLGNNATANRSSPVSVVGGITNWRQVSAGGWVRAVQYVGNTYHSHSLGVTNSGLAYSWGGNYDGQLGTNNTTARSSPVSVVGNITNWSQVSAGGFHSLGVTSAGVAYAWGYGANGVLGNNAASNRSSPVSVVGGITWNQVSAGNFHSLGGTSSGVLYAWGAGNTGTLGNNATSNRSSPVSVVGGITTWTQFEAGGSFSSGITSTGVLYSWGSGANGKLGINATTNRSSPVSVVGSVTNWTQVTAGGNHAIGLARI